MKENLPYRVSITLQLFPLERGIDAALLEKIDRVAERCGGLKRSHALRTIVWEHKEEEQEDEQ